MIWDRRFRTFIQQSSEGIWSFSVDPAPSVQDSVDAQITAFYRYHRVSGRYPTGFDDLISPTDSPPPDQEG